MRVASGRNLPEQELVLFRAGQFAYANREHIPVIKCRSLSKFQSARARGIYAREAETYCESFIGQRSTSAQGCCVTERCDI